MTSEFECPYCSGKLSIIHDDPYDPDRCIYIFKSSDITYNQFTHDYKEPKKEEKEDGMIRITNNNCGFGMTTIEIKGYQELEHAADYLSARSGNKTWDRPYLGDFDKSRKYLKDNLRKDHVCEILLCMGGGSMPEYERLMVELVNERKD